jgi:S-DNA-T family DNA segregation ATPase FtsK/SpoIIIE
VPSGQLELQEPPVLPERQNSMSALLSYMPMAIMSLSMVMLYARPGATGSSGAYTYVIGGVMVASTSPSSCARQANASNAWAVTAGTTSAI